MSTPLVLEKILADVAFWIGLVSVLLFAYSRFNISLPDTDELSPPLEPRSFTTAFRFQLAAFTYVGLYAALYFVLLLAGSFPWLQTVVKELFGSLDEAGKEGVGTPAWAALVATSILPSTPGFRWIDERWRVLLHDFASIPAKARMLGREILKGLPLPAPQHLAADVELKTAMDALALHKERFARLYAAAEGLTQTDAARASRRYRAFFSAHKSVIDQIEQEFAVAAEHCSTVESALYVERRFRSALRKAARFLACATLNAEASEYAIRSRLQEVGIRMRIVGFDFRPGHLVLAVTTIALMTVLGCYVSVLAYALVHDANPLPLLDTYSGTFFSWVIVTVAIYLLPLVLAAGVEMYLIDRVSSGEPIDGTDYAALAIMTFIGAAGLAFFALLVHSFVVLKIVAANLHGETATHGIPFSQLLPWALPPATVATVFLAMAGRDPATPPVRAVAVDALAHGGAAAAASILALFLATVAGSSFRSVPPGMMIYLAPITAGAIGASIGAVLCMTCRRRFGSLRPSAAPMTGAAVTP